MKILNDVANGPGALLAVNDTGMLDARCMEAEKVVVLSKDHARFFQSELEVLGIIRTDKVGIVRDCHVDTASS